MHLRQQTSPKPGMVKPSSNPHQVHDGKGLSLVPPPFVQTGSQQQIPDRLCRLASSCLGVWWEGARSRRCARCGLREGTVRLREGALVQLELVVLGSAFAHGARCGAPAREVRGCDTNAAISREVWGSKTATHVKPIPLRMVCTFQSALLRLHEGRFT